MIQAAGSTNPEIWRRIQARVISTISRIGAPARMQPSSNSETHFRILSELSLAPESPENDRRISTAVSAMKPEQFGALVSLSSKNHVVVRALSRLSRILRAEEGPQTPAVDSVLKDEKMRIDHALKFLDEICAGLEKSGCTVTVIKSLDHWPDLGSDLDLYTDADEMDVVRAMRSAFQAKVDERSWGDRLANKWNFIVPGLPELVEIHIRRLGQTGEQTAVTQTLAGRTRILNISSYSYRVLSPEHRIIVSTLQRMYRHFYIRLCDVVDNAHLVESGSVDFDYLHELGTAAGIWEGIATYLTIISGYVESYRGYGVLLPSLVTSSAKFLADQVSFRRDFLRVPILPHSLNLYAAELRTLVFRGQVRDSLRLSLLPGLATAAALEMKITGSDKGIW